MQIKCPQCKNKHEYTTENPFRPFCSERCKTLDLGAWAEESYSLASDEVPSEDELIEAYKKQEN